MEPCDDTYKQWQQIQSLVEDLQEACDEHERHWQEDFYGALDNLIEPEPFLRSLLRSRKEFDAFLLCKRKYELILSTQWTDAVVKLHDCVEDYTHQDVL
jgi:hypothetical protein